MKKIKKIEVRLLIASYLLLIVFLPIFQLSAQETLPSVVTDPTGAPATLNMIIANMAKLVLGLVGVLALIMFIIGGITWMTSAGNAEAVKKGKGILVWSAIGLIVCFFAYSLVTFVITRFIGVGAS